MEWGLGAAGRGHMCATVTRTACVGEPTTTCPAIHQTTLIFLHRIPTITTISSWSPRWSPPRHMPTPASSLTSVAGGVEVGAATLALGYRTCPGLTWHRQQLSTHVPARSLIYITLE